MQISELNLRNNIRNNKKLKYNPSSFQACEKKIFFSFRQQQASQLFAVKLKKISNSKICISAFIDYT